MSWQTGWVTNQTAQAAKDLAAVIECYSYTVIPPEIQLDLAAWTVFVSGIVTTVVVLAYNGWLHFDGRWDARGRWIGKCLWAIVAGTVVACIVRSIWYYPDGDIFERVAQVGWMALGSLLLYSRLISEPSKLFVLTPFAIPIFLCRTYEFASRLWITNAIGCGCDVHGFNGNDLISLAQFLITLLCWGVLLWEVRRLRLLHGVAYVIVGLPLAALLTWAGLMMSLTM